MNEEAPNLLVVCTANKCRSPMAAALLRRSFDKAGLEINVSSAGFLDGGDGAHESSIAVMRSMGLDLTDHRPARLTRPMVAVQDLILTMARSHVRDILDEWPDAEDRTFTMGWMTRVDQGPASLDPDDFASWTALLHARRLPGDIQGTGPDEVRDPLGRPRRVFAATARLIERQADRIARLLDTSTGAGRERRSRINR